MCVMKCKSCGALNDPYEVEVVCALCNQSDYVTVTCTCFIASYTRIQNDLLISRCSVLISNPTCLVHF